VCSQEHLTEEGLKQKEMKVMGKCFELYVSPAVVKVVKGRLKWAGHAAWKGR
jgi:hypothetical protein